MELTIDEALQKGIESHKAGKIEDAERIYSAILKAQPKHPDANHNMGILSVGAGKIQEALPFFKIALEAKSSVAQFWLSYINSLIKLDRLSEAKAVFDRAKDKGAKGETFDQLEQQLLEKEFEINETDTLEIKGSNCPKHNILDTIELDKALRLAKRKLKDGQPEEAKSIYEDILQKFPKHKQALIDLQSLIAGVTMLPKDPPSDLLQPIINLYTQGQLQQALFHATDMLERFPNSVVLYNIAGASNGGLMQFDAAIDNYKQALKIKPDSAEVYNNMGVLLTEMGDRDAAISSYQQALKIEPNYAAAHNNMGNALKGRCDLNAALDSYKQALKLNPDNAEIHNNMGNVLKDQGDLQAAIDSYQQALNLNPVYVEVYNNMGTLLTERGDPEAAIENYKMALKIKPDFAETYNNMGTALKAKGDMNAALDSYKKALKLNPVYAEAYNNIGVLFTERGDPEAAIASYQLALKIKPDFAETYNNMGTALKNKGNIEDAMGSHKQALKINPGYAEAYNNIGILLTGKGNFEAAIASYKEALKIDPDYAKAYFNLGLLFLEIEQYEKAAECFNSSDFKTSKHYLLRCLYLLDKKSHFYDQLDDFIKHDEVHPMIGSFVSRSTLRYGIKRPNLYCSDPLNYVLKTDLNCQYDFEELFVKTTRTIINESRVPIKRQTLLTNGYQTAGNLFDSAPDLTNDIQKTIRQEIKKYQHKFQDSKEGLITNWPNDYTLYGWLVIMKSGGQLQPHMHEQGWISGSVYVNVPTKPKAGSGNLVVCIEANQIMGETINQGESIDVVTGSLCLFPASLLHYTIPFDSEEERIVLAFDVVPKY